MSKNKSYKYKFIPQNIIAEDTLLGTILIYPNILHIIKKTIKKEYFFLEINQILYTYLVELNPKDINQIINIINKLYNNKLLFKVGGMKKVIRLIKQGNIFISSERNIEYIKILVSILHKNYLKRLIIQCGYNIINIGYIKNIGVQQIYSQTLLQISSIEQEIKINNTNKLSNIKELISKKLIEIKYQSLYSIIKKHHKNIKCGFIEIDNLIPHLEQGNLIIIAGRPSIGKTSFAINIAYNVFFNQQNSLLIFSLEMSKNELFNKLISIGLKTNINSKTIQKLSHKQWHTMSHLCNKLLENNIYINDKNNISIEYIGQITKKIKKNAFINLIIIDYLQLIELQTDKQHKYSRSQELGYITRKLKLLAQLLELPIITISQLNRNIETRVNKEPLLSDLKESGCIQYTININVACKYNQNTNIKSIYKNNNKIQLKTLRNKKNIYYKKAKYKAQNELLYIKGYINLSQEYNFSYVINLNQLIITHNHKYLSKNVWTESNKVLTCTKINIIENLTNSFIRKSYIQDISFNQYSKSYDINQNRYFTIINKNIITHNSIEQDADIILSLYEKNDKKFNNNMNDQKIIDLKVSKNRNGYTGYCQLLFLPETSIFQDFYKCIN